MGNKVIDVEFILDQSNQANDALSNMVYCIQELKKIYVDVLGDMKSNEFIKEFDESITEIIDETDKISEETIEGIITSLANLAIAFEEADIDLSKM